VALDSSELERLANIKQRAIANGVEGLEEVGPERLRDIEPHAAGIRALWSPKSGIIDFRQVALAYADEVRSRGGTILTSHEVMSIRSTESERVVATGSGEFVARDLISCGGLYSDRLAAMTGDAGHE